MKPTHPLPRVAPLAVPLLLALAGCATTADEARPPAVILAEAGKLEVTNAHAPFPGVLTSGQLTEEQLTALAALGYRTFVNLRAPDEPGTGWEAGRAAELGVGYVSIPVASAQDVSEENARRLSQALAAGGQPAVVYCKSGNRVGALFALEAFFVDGKPAEESLAIGRAAGVTRLEPRVREVLGLE